MKVAVLCDLHLPLLKSAAQYDVLDWEIGNIIEEGTDLTVVAGDITAGGELETLEYFRERISGLNHMFLLGNSDIRNPFFEEKIISKYGESIQITFENYSIVGISTPFPYLTERDRELLWGCEEGSIVFLHHNPAALQEESREFLTKVLRDKALTVIHGHKHLEMEEIIGKSRIIGVTGQDPDKVKGLPSVTYFEFGENMFKKYDRFFPLKSSAYEAVLKAVGMSCFDPYTDIEYAIRNQIPNIEIQLRKAKDLEQFPVIRAQVIKWREQGGKYLSCHLPELRLTDGVLQGVEVWYHAIELLKELSPDGVTVHVPRASIKDMIVDGMYWRQYLFHYVTGLKKLPENTRIGIENLHMLSMHKYNNEERLFGLVPEECLMWIDALNIYLGENRVGAVLDVGHATNNTVFRARYTRSMWYEIMGQRLVAYHVHQVVNTPEGLKNHNAIADWLGMTVSYASFFWAWEKEHINHVPVFLEMKNVENCDVSINALKELVERNKEKKDV